jgi:glutamyl-tRNA synthetase
MAIITRFAPSPTGLLHVGNIRTALINWLYARANGGQFILRIDDTDRERSQDIYVDHIKNDLEWLGLGWDMMFFQSKRTDLYANAKDQLIKSGRLYPCYETEEELAIKKKILSTRNLPPIYDRAALKLTDAQKNELEQSGLKPHWRFLISDSPIEWVDGIKGQMKFSPAALSDPILIRTDGSMTYTLASVVDDIDLGITNIIRGEDHISNSAIHQQIFEALGHKMPNLSHLSLLNSKNQEISKRLGGFDIKSLREIGIEAMTINSFLSKIGTSDPIVPTHVMSEIVQSFDITKFGKSPSNYDQKELEQLNLKIIHHMSYRQVKERLAQQNLDGLNENFWDAVKSNISTVQEVSLWWKICHAILQPSLDDYSFTKTAASLLPQEPWDAGTWDIWINKVKLATKKSGKELFMPIRIALTGIDHGPELKQLLPMLGYQKAIQRLNGIAA